MSARLAHHARGRQAPGEAPHERAETTLAKEFDRQVENLIHILHAWLPVLRPQGHRFVDQRRQAEVWPVPGRQPANEAVLLVLIVVQVGLIACSSTLTGSLPTANSSSSETLVAKLSSRSTNGKTFTASPNSRRVAFVAQAGSKQVVFVDGKENKRYDDLVPGTKIIFDSPDRFHYLAVKGNNVFLVQETVK